MKTAALYARVSKNTQNPETQLLPLREYAQRREIGETIEYIDFAWSGAKRRRPQLDQLMRDARLRRFDAVIVQRFDRFGRSAQHLVMTLEEFEGLKIEFISLNEMIDTSSPVGKVMFWIIGALAEMEREIIRERINDGLARARAEGKQLGRPKRIFDREEVFKLKAEGLSPREIARKMRIGEGTVRRTLKKPRQNRLAQFRGRVVKGNPFPGQKSRAKTK